VHPTLEEVRLRAAPWSSHLTVEPAFEGGGVAAYLLRGLLAPEEAHELLELAARNMESHQKPESDFHAMIEAGALPELNATAAVARLNARLSALTGLPESHIEDGYYNVYNAGHEIQGLHLDNHVYTLAPKRVWSFVINLLSEGLVGGGTVFPLAPPGQAERWQLKAEHLAAWDRDLRPAADVRPGEHPQRARACPMGLPALPNRRDPCPTVMDIARSVCRSSADSEGDLSKGVVHLRAGDAIMLSQLNGAGRETARAIHAACPVEAGDKVTLSKFVRGGPKPFSGVDADTEAWQQWLLAGGGWAKLAAAPDEL